MEGRSWVVMRRRRALAYFQYTRTRTHSTVSMVVPLIPSLRTEQGLRQDWPLATLISCFSCFTGRSRWRGGTGTHETAAHNGRAPNELAISPILAREVPTKLRLPAGPAPPPPQSSQTPSRPPIRTYSTDKVQAPVCNKTGALLSPPPTGRRMANAKRDCPAWSCRPF